MIIPLLPINRRTFDVLRYEFAAFRLNTLNLIDPLAKTRRWRLRKARELSVNIGSGGKGLSGWINIELRRHADTTIVWDIRRSLPFADATVRRIFAEHVIEHLDFRDDIPKLFSEFMRVLVPGGAVRIVVPDAERFLEAYAKSDNRLWQELGWDIQNLPEDIFTPMHAINHIFHQGGEHLFAYDFATLALMLNRAGFSTVIKQAFQCSVDGELAIDQANHRPYSLYVDAIKEPVLSRSPSLTKQSTEHVHENI